MRAAGRFLVFGVDHLRYLIGQYVEYYHTKRSHRDLDYKTPKQVETNEQAESIETLAYGDLVRHESLGGALKWYERKAA